MKKKGIKRLSKKKSKDFSNKTVVIMLVLVVIVSILSLGLYLNALQNSTTQAQTQNEYSGEEAKGVASMVIMQVPRPSEAKGEANLVLSALPEEK